MSEMEYKLNRKLSTALEPYRNAIAATIQPYIEIKLTDNADPTWWQSKFGGMPYLPRDFAYPQSQAGEYLYLLAQINLSEIPNIDLLPQQGILQFYIGAEKNMYGLNFEQPTQQDSFRVLYFAEVNLNGKDLVTDFSFLDGSTKPNLPFSGCCGLEFKLNYEPISASDYKLAIFGDDYAAEDEYWEIFGYGGHQLLGYPYFTQEDPRYSLNTDEPYILLLQIDSESNDNIRIVWGDMGIANFFIKRSDLSNLNFEHILYNWDCT